MSTLKTVIVTTAVLLLGAALTLVGYIIWSQDQELRYLSAKVTLLDAQMDAVQNQTLANTARLSRTIKTVNHNFSNFDDREKGLETVIKIIVKALSSDPDTPASPTSLQHSNSRNGL
jgi:hypothetical protein